MFLTYPKWATAADAQSIADKIMATPEPDPTVQVTPVKSAAKKKAAVKAAVLPDHLQVGPSEKEKSAVKAVAKAGAHLEAQGFVPELVPSVIPLKEARAVGQQVAGTSKGSSYRAFAIGPVNLAVKVGGGQASIRAEAQGLWLAAHKSKLTALGFSDNGSYMSVHMQLGEVPAIRVLGAVAFSMDMKFSQIATSMEAING